ncbi:hypothetical protein GLOIN_2v1787109 [Rhizophagus irregularis DAOM 181602=DAOM 197198]|nr:hypothetical protein GLOIN_2v1787109 [Rhizophagus irregularis DAOM 181602=DAOM 197198]
MFISEENTGRVDYVIKALEELVCITETWTGSRVRIKIRYISRDRFNEGFEEELDLQKYVKQVLDVVVDLLKDRVDVKKSPSKKETACPG